MRAPINEYIEIRLRVCVCSVRQLGIIYCEHEIMIGGDGYYDETNSTNAHPSDFFFYIYCLLHACALCTRVFHILFVCFFSQYSVLFVVNVLIQILCIAFFIHQCFHKSNRILEGAFDDTKCIYNVLYGRCCVARRAS